MIKSIDVNCVINLRVRVLAKSEYLIYLLTNNIQNQGLFIDAVQNVLKMLKCAKSHNNCVNFDQFSFATADRPGIKLLLFLFNIYFTLNIMINF